MAGRTFLASKCFQPNQEKIMSNVAAVNDALASAIHLANKRLRRNQNHGIGIISIPGSEDRMRLILGENRHGALVQLISMTVRVGNLPRHVERIERAMKRRARHNPYTNPLVFQEVAYWGSNFSRCWSLTYPYLVGDDMVVVPYNPT
jgi:hypothetical protein